MRNMQQVFTAEFERTAKEAGLELAVDDLTSPSNCVTFLAMDGLDTRMTIVSAFQHNYALFVLAGEAVDALEHPFFKSHDLYPKNTATGRALEFRIEYSAGPRVRWLLSVMADALAPYVVKPEDS